MAYTNGTLFKGQALSNGLAANLAALSFAKAYTRLIPGGSAKLTALLSMLSTKTAVQIEHFYYTKSMVFASAQINEAAGYLAGDTVLTVDSTATILPGHILQVFRTSEQLYVVSVDSATQVTVARAYGTTAAAALVDNDFMPVVGSAFEEASARPGAASINPSRIFNYTQIFRNSWALSDTLRAIETIAGNGNVAENRLDCMEMHMRDMESALLFGELYTGTVNSKPFRKMDGIVNSVKRYAAANVSTMAATTNYTQLEDALDPIFDTQSDPKIGPQRILFVGGQAKKVITGIGRKNAQYEIVEGSDTGSFGLQFERFRISRGEFLMMEHPLLNSNADWKKMAIAVDLSSMALAFMAGRNTKSEEFGINGKYVENGLDAVGGSLTTEATLELTNPFANGVLYNLTASAVG